MKKLSLILFSLLNITSCSNNDDFIGSGILISETRDVSTFNKVSSEGVFTVRITQGDTPSVEVTADNNIIDKVRTNVTNNELSLSLDGGNFENITVEVNITMAMLNQLKNTGTGDVFVSQLNQQNTLKIINEGTGDVSISGTTNNLDVFNKGTGELWAFELLTTNADIEIEGSGDCEVFSEETLDVIINGSGKVFYKGNPSISSNISGSGSIINAN